MTTNAVSGYVIRPAGGGDLPALRDLLTRTLLKSGGPHELDDEALRIWLNPHVSYTLVACPADDPSVVAATAQISRVVTSVRNVARLEVVAADPGHRGRGLMLALVGRLFWHAQEVWMVGKIMWTSEDVPNQQHARHLYIYVFEAGVDPGSNCNFTIRCPWRVPEKLRPHFVPLNPGE